MSQIAIQYGECFEDVPKVLLTRIVGTAATAINQASVTALSYLVKSYASKENAETDTTGTTVTAEAGLSPVSTYIFDALQTDNDWGDTDSVGYNFKFTVPKASFPTKALWYRVEAWVDPTTGEDFPGGVWILYCKATARD